jgi:PhnB protein
MQLQPYLFFCGRCDEAIAHYRDVLGATVEMLMRFRESPEPAPPGMLPPDWGDKVMHATLRIGDSIVMASDGNCGTASFSGFSLSLSPSDEASARRTFDALGAGGSVQMPLGKTFWSSCFGMLTDRFGVEWMINVDQPR